MTATTNQNRSFYCSSLLEVSSNQPALVNFKFGGVVDFGPRLQFTDSHLVSEYTCGLPEKYEHVELVETLSKNLSGIEGACVVKRKSLPMGIKATMVVDCSDLNRVKIFTNEMYEKWSRLRGTCAVQTPEETAATLGYAQLLAVDALPIHCAAVAKDGRAAIIIAPSNTGKTVSTWRLVTEMGFDFIAEDIAIIKDNVIYGCPYTCTDVPDGVRKSKVSLASKFKKVFYPNQPKECLALYVDQNSILPSAKISQMIFLRRGTQEEVKTVDREQVFDVLQKNNCLEFRYRSHPLLLELWYRYGYPNVQQMIDTENSLLRTLAESTESVTEIIAPDPTRFSQIIADNF